MSAGVASPAQQQPAGAGPALPAEQQQRANTQQQQASSRVLMKRKRSSDAASECTTHTTECETDTSPQQAFHGAPQPADATAHQLAGRRQQHATERLQLEERLQQLQEQQQHVAQQLEQLEGCDRDAAGDLRKQLQAYEQQHAAAADQLVVLGRTFEADVAAILSTAPGAGAPQALAAAVQEQQQLQDAQVAQLAVEQQLGGFAVTAPSSKHKHKDKRARLDSVWTWLQDSSSVAAEAAGQLARPEVAGQQPPQDNDDEEAATATAAVAAAGASPLQRSPAATPTAAGAAPQLQQAAARNGKQQATTNFMTTSLER